MNEILQNVITSPAFWWGMGGSVLMLLLMLAGTVWVLVQMPADVLQQKRSSLPVRLKNSPWGVRIVLILKNLLAMVFLISGFLMLFLPGQGLLTLLAGVLLLDFPGKQRLERWLLEKRSVYHAINWLRGQFNQPELELKEQTEGSRGGT